MRTCAQQLLYEVHDPAGYVTPDAIADFSRARLDELGHDAVAVSDITGRPRPATLKVSVAYRAGYLGEGQISYAGAQAATRGQLALDVVAERLRRRGIAATDIRFELIGVGAVHRGAAPARGEPAEVRARVAGRTADRDQAEWIGHEVAALWLNGPAGGAGATTHVHEVIAVASVLLPRDRITTQITMMES